MSSTGGHDIRAKEACADFELSDSARQLLREDQSAQAFLKLLIEREEYGDAVQLLAHLLPAREAVWWASCCVRRSGAKMKPAMTEALEAAEKWVVEPTDEHRRAAGKMAERAKLDNPAALSAMAAFWSGGSVAPEGAAEARPPEHLYSKAVLGAVVLAVVSSEPEKAVEEYRDVLELGVSIQRGEKLWTGTGRETGAAKGASSS